MRWVTASFYLSPRRLTNSPSRDNSVSRASAHSSARRDSGEDSLELLASEAQTETDALPDAMPYEYAVGRRLMGQALEQGVKAIMIIGVNDMTAIGLIDEIKARGYSVPGDFSVCGFDNIFTSAISTPQLTTIDHHLQVRCKAAVDQITARRRETSARRCFRP